MKNIAFLCAVLAVSIGLAQDKTSQVGSWKLDAQTFIVREAKNHIAQNALLGRILARCE